MSIVEHLGGGGAFGNPYSRVVRAGDFVFVSGQVGLVGRELVPGGIQAETRRALERTAEALSLAGCELADIVKATVYLADSRDFELFNRIYAEFFATKPPARSTVIASLIVGGRVEIDVIAYRPKPRPKTVSGRPKRGGAV